MGSDSDMNGRADALTREEGERKRQGGQRAQSEAARDVARRSMCVRQRGQGRKGLKDNGDGDGDGMSPSEADQRAGSMCARARERE
jgi:hypothetical protein